MSEQDKQFNEWIRVRAGKGGIYKNNTKFEAYKNCTWCAGAGIDYSGQPCECVVMQVKE